jgi:hypothetical protein
MFWETGSEMGKNLNANGEGMEREGAGIQGIQSVRSVPSVVQTLFMQVDADSLRSRNRSAAEIDAGGIKSTQME